MQINPKSKTVTYPLNALEDIVLRLEDLEKEALENDDISGDIARSIICATNSVRQSLGFKKDVVRHKKFAPELQNS